MNKQINPVVKEVLADFEERARERRPFDVQWQMNMNFYMGNQFCGVNYGGNVDEINRQYFWEEREVFNHIASKIDIRLSKLTQIKPNLRVFPASNEERDLYTAKVSKKILDAVSDKYSLQKKINQATKWSEICGTSFYKVFWNTNLGQTVAVDEDNKEIKSGDVDISVCSPFEIYPDSSFCENIEDCQSLIHAKVYTRNDVRLMYGIEVDGQNIDIFTLNNAKNLGGLGYNSIGSKLISSTKKDAVLVLEKYVRPSVEYPNGRLIIVAGDKLVYDGELPYINGQNGKRDFPFIKQVCADEIGSFWGKSLIERMIPVQRAYNAVKNRKHEYLNRLTMGVLTVEDGSVDVDNLEEEGLAPGKILVYRQGANAPKYLESENISTDFEKEEERLLNEFTSISGTNDFGDIEKVSSSVSGVALELLIDENESRLAFTSDSLKEAVKDVGQHILRLYKQYASLPRIAKIVGENGEPEIFYFTSNDISSEDVKIDTDYLPVDTLSQRREMVYTLIEKGILNDDDGKLSASTKNKILEMIGFGVWESAKDVEQLHIRRADNENLAMLKGNVMEVKAIDNHELHINEHIAFMLSGSFDFDKGDAERIFMEHIAKHKQLLKENKNEEE